MHICYGCSILLYSIKLFVNFMKYHLHNLLNNAKKINTIINSPCKFKINQLVY